MKGVAGVGVAVGGCVAGTGVGFCSVSSVVTAVKSVVGGNDVAVAEGSSAMGSAVGSGDGSGELHEVISKISKIRTNNGFLFAIMFYFLIL
jgi:hypothetical protein